MGKSTIIKKVLSSLPISYSGFFTKKVSSSDNSGDMSVHIYSAVSNHDTVFSDKNCVGQRQDSIMTAFNKVFDSLGCNILTSATDSDVIVMDELGFLENNACKFRQSVLNLVRSNKTILGVIKSKQTEFLDEIRHDPNTLVLTVTPQNRDNVLSKLIKLLSPLTISDAIGISRFGDVVSAVGGGGKTTLMNTLATELSSVGYKVALTTTTRMLMPILSTDCPLKCSLDDLDDAYKNTNCISSGTPDKEGKLSPPSKDALYKLPQISDFTLIEADGSKRLPLKAPAEHEPQIFDFTTHVVAVAGLDALGCAIKKICHRPHIVSKLVGKSEDDLVEVKDISTVLTSDYGAKKSVLPHMKYTVLLNKADTVERIAFAEKIANILMENGICRVVVASLSEGKLIKVYTK